MTNSENNDQEHSDSHAVETDNSLENLGERLVRAREAKGMGVREVAERLKISATYVRELEAGRYESLPGITFARGYLKSYAKLLGLDESKVIELFNAEKAPHDETDSNLSSPDVVSLRRKKQRMTMSAGFAFVLLFIIGGGIYLWRDAGIATLALEAEEAIQAVDIIDVVSSGSLKESDQTVGAISSAVDDDRLVIEFRTDCWVRVQNANNEVLFSDFKSGGTGLHLSAKGPLNIIFADMSAIQTVYYNDKPITFNMPTSGNKVGQLKLG
ncbi:MAG: helix-turn-helix domain-containing protein [Endozoicomonadaceae bacterium]|nr:helix-turn-helix domain-containing protein [Endozoicomonadaceae bacterium]